MPSIPPAPARASERSRPASIEPSAAPGATRLGAPIGPRRFGRYQIFDRIGRGGMADIFLARMPTDIGADRLVVLKQILDPLSRDETFARMFIEEAKLCASLRHANIVQVLDLGREQGLLYMAMEYVEGFDLHQLLARCSRAQIPLPAEFAIFVVREVLAALDFAHRATDGDGRPLGIVHRDVSPSNVLVSFEGEVKLCDFGIARAAGRAVDEGGPSEALAALRARLVGKSAYMSPEHARGEDLDARADVFAAGILLWELCAGRRLYRGSEEEMLAQARRGQIPPLAERGLPAAGHLQSVLDRALAFDREARFATARDFLDALDEYARAARLFASQLRLGAFLDEHFGKQVIEDRRARQRAARALEKGPPVRIEPIAPPPTPLAELDTGKVAIVDDDTQPQAVPPHEDPARQDSAPEAVAARSPRPAAAALRLVVAVAVLLATASAIAAWALR